MSVLYFVLLHTKSIQLMNKFTKSIFFSIFLFLFGATQMLHSQDVLMSNDTVTACNGAFYDTGGFNGDYSANENLTLTICSDGSTGSHVQLVFLTPTFAAGDDLCFFDGMSDAATPISCAVNDFIDNGATSFIVQASSGNTTGCLTMVFTSDGTGEASGWGASINCIPACQNIIAELNSTDPAVVPVDTGWINACQGERILFSANGLYPQNNTTYDHSDFTSSFEWDFGDGSTSVGPNASHVFDEAKGYIVQLTITDQLGCRNTNFISQRIRISTTPEFRGFGDVSQICVNDTVHLAGTADTIHHIGSEVSTIATESSFVPSLIQPTDTVSLPDGVGVAYESVLSVEQFVTGQTLNNINDLLSIFVNMEHSWMRDLEIKIECPDGVSVILHDHPGNTGGEIYLGVPIDGDNPPNPGQGWDYWWTPNSTNGTWIEFSNGPNSQHTLPSQDYEAFDDLQDLVGCSLNGEWTMTVTDLWGGDNGFLFAWGLEFANDLFPPIEVYTPEIVNFAWESNPSIIFQEQTVFQDSIVAIPQNAGTASYTFFVDDDFGCQYDTTITIDVLPETHPDCHNCAENVSIPNDVVMCEGDTAFFDVSGNINLETSVTFEAVPLYEIGFANHPNTNAYRSIININSIAPLILNNPLTQISSVCFDMETDFISDIRVFLRAPSGEMLELTTNNGPGNGNYTNTCFTPSAVSPITTGAPPFTGNFQPEGAWSDLQGAGVIGDWELLVSDGFGPNEMGRLNSWSITFNSLNELTYSWTPPTGLLFCNDCPTPAANPSVTTDYIVQSEDLYGCLNLDTITVSIVNTLLAPEVTCESIGGGMMTFSWPPILPGSTYDLQVTINGVVSPWENEVTDNLYIVNGLSFGDEVSMDIKVHVNSTSLNCDVAVGSTSCIYNECGVNDEIIIDSIVVTDVSCFGTDTGSASIFLSNGYEPYSFQWDDTEQQILSTAVFLPAGTYHVIITDSVFCITETDVIINQPDLLVLDVNGEDAKCLDGTDGSGTVTPAGGIMPYTYLWDNGDTEQTTTNLGAGTHNVMVTDDNGCQESIDINIGEPASAVSLTINQTLQGCYEESENEATVLPTGGTGTNYTYEWGGGQNTQTAINLTEGDAFVTVYDENGCSAEAMVALIDLDTLFGDIIIIEPSCFNFPDGSLGLNNFGGGAGQDGIEADYTFVWDSGHNGLVANNVLGGFTYAVTIEDAQGCQTVIARALNNPPPIEFKLDPENTLCFDSLDGRGLITEVTGTQGTYNIQWDVQANSQITSIATDLGVGVYWVSITDEMGCEAIQSVEINQPTEVKIEYSTVDNECFGDALGQIEVGAFGGTPSYTFEWPTYGNTQLLNTLPAGIYDLSVTDANGCLQQLAIEVTQPEPLSATFETRDITCYGDRNGTIIATPSGGVPPFQYSLDNQNFVGSSTLIGLIGGAYNVYMQDANGCVFIGNATITEPEEFMVTAGSDRNLNLGDSIRIWASSENGEGDVIYVWYPPYDGTTDCTECPAPWFFPQNTLIYELFGEDENGCTDTDFLTINVQKPRLAVVPTGFTPNADGVNDILQVHGLPGTIVKVFRVYDRWGELLFEANDFEVNQGIGWDGTFRSDQMNAGVYIWSMVVEYPHDKETAEFMGEVTLIR